MTKPTASALTPATEDQSTPHRATATSPTACPDPWCALGAPDSAEHDGGGRATVHRSAEAIFAGPADEHGGPVLVRAELFKLVEEGEDGGDTVMYVQGETDVQLDTVADVDAFIGDIAPFLTALWTLRKRMAEGR